MSRSPPAFPFSEQSWFLAVVRLFLHFSCDTQWVTFSLLLSLSPTVCDLSIIFYIKYVLSPARIHNIVAFLFTLRPLLLSSRLLSLAPLSKSLWCAPSFFFGLSRLITCDHPTIKAAAIELPWQHLVHAVTATAESTGRQRHTHIHKHTHTHTHTHTQRLPCTTQATLAHLF